MESTQDVIAQAQSDFPDQPLPLFPLPTEPGIEVIDPILPDQILFTSYKPFIKGIIYKHLVVALFSEKVNDGVVCLAVETANASQAKRLLKLLAKEDRPCRLMINPDIIGISIVKADAQFVLLGEYSKFHDRVVEEVLGIEEKGRREIKVTSKHHVKGSPVLNNSKPLSAQPQPGGECPHKSFYVEGWDKLVKKLTAHGGEMQETMPEAPEQMKPLLSGGRIFNSSKVQVQPGDPESGIVNMIELWTTNKHLQFVSGYALRDELWRRHSWLWNPRTEELLEFTSAAEKYFGVVWSDCQAFTMFCQMGVIRRRLFVTEHFGNRKA